MKIVISCLLFFRNKFDKKIVDFDMQISAPKRSGKYHLGSPNVPDILKKNMKKARVVIIVININKSAFVCELFIFFICPKDNAKLNVIIANPIQKR